VIQQQARQPQSETETKTGSKTGSKQQQQQKEQGACQLGQCTATEPVCGELDRVCWKRAHVHTCNTQVPHAAQRTAYRARFVLGLGN
jgi:hypothetical protein